MSVSRTALVAYDGSSCARDAIDAVARLIDGHCVVLNVVRDDVGAAVVPVAPGAPIPMDSVVDDVRARNRSEGRRLAEEGATRARAAGIDAEGRMHELERGGDVAGAIVAVADEIGADVIAVGHHGHGAVRAALFGSVSKGVLQAADRPVLAVR